jgi:hypothetical protein
MDANEPSLAGSEASSPDPGDLAARDGGRQMRRSAVCRRRSPSDAAPGRLRRKHATSSTVRSGPSFGLAPVFKLDTPTGIARAGTVDLRPPVSATCTANPTNADGSTCQAAALGTPFFLFADGAAGAQHLFADA